MRTYNTTLSLVNFSGKKIVSTAVAIDGAEDWDDVTDDPQRRSRPDLNFTGVLDDGDARCEREEISASTNKGCWLGLTLTFDDQSQISFRANQWEATSKQTSGSWSYAPANSGLEVVRTTGQDRYVYTQAFYLRPTTAPDNSGWMSRLLFDRPKVKLNEITMPGSHDAGMYDVKGSEWARTQQLSIGDQLKAGSRYFDLRVCTSGGELWTYHSDYYGDKLSNILGYVKAFLDANTMEAVFLKFRSYASDDRQATVDMVQATLSSELFKASASPIFAQLPLLDLAGKAVAVFTPDYAGLLDPSRGTFPYRDYGNEDTGASMPPADNRCLGVYDAYSHNSEYAVMDADQHSKLKDHGGVRQGLPVPVLVDVDRQHRQHP